MRATKLHLEYKLYLIKSNVKIFLKLVRRNQFLAVTVKRTTSYHSSALQDYDALHIKIK